MIRIFLLFVLFFSLLSSCSNALDIAPSERVFRNLMTNEKETEEVIFAVYGMLQDEALYGRSTVMAGEIASEIVFVESKDRLQSRYSTMDDFSVTTDNIAVNDIWRVSYKTIQLSNIILNRIPNIQFNNEQTKRYRTGEIQFVRALLYFNLIRMFGDVPLVVNEISNPSETFAQGRTPVNDVLNFLINDLQLAIQNLPLEKSIGRPARGAAQALLSQIHMYTGNHDKAMTLLESLILSSQYNLQPSTDKIFTIENQNNQEVIFDIQYSANSVNESEENILPRVYMPLLIFANSEGQLVPEPSFINSYSPLDSRIFDYFTTITDKKYINKYPPNIKGTSELNFIVIRYADIILRYAEILNEKNRLNEALTQLNKIRTRAGLNKYETNDKETLRLEIQSERKRELVGEGFSWFDTKRYNAPVTFMNAYFKNTNSNIRIDTDDLLLPIPQNQINTNPDILIQNPGY